jgi:acyl-CoA oxidase
VASLETTADFDKEKDEFVLNTPTITSTKYWPGDMGNHANYAVLYARCRVGTKDYGVCPFIV